MCFIWSTTQDHNRSNDPYTGYVLPRRPWNRQYHSVVPVATSHTLRRTRRTPVPPCSMAPGHDEVVHI